MVFYFYSFNTFISIIETGTSVAILYNSIESKNPWQTQIRIKESDRRLFILIVDSILVYATTLIM